ncbi:MAG: peptidoglycan-binding domain-containing protein [Bradyrhizobium sp.]
MPRRRRAAAAAMDDEEGRGLVLRILQHSPKDTLAAFVAFGACSVIVANALFLQKEPHPAPMFRRAFVPRGAFFAPRPLPRPRPAQADAARPEPIPDPRRVERRAADPLANLMNATTGALPRAHVLRPPAPIPHQRISESRRVAAVQRVLSEYGYGQLRPTGVLDQDTRAAIRRFEERRRMPVTGQISARLVRELSAMTGHPIE